MAAMEDGKVKLEDSIDANKGRWQFHDREMLDHLEYNKLTYRNAFEESVNTVTARMIDDAYARNLDGWFKHLENFGLTSPVMLQEHIVGEPTPKLIRPGDEHWNMTSLPWMAIGYNTQLTPLQILTFYNAVANGGKMMEPILVKRIRNGSRILQEFNAKVLHKQIASKNTIRQARELLEGVVENGTAKRIRLEECRIAGKTGTAKKYNPATQRYERRYQASFCGYFPAEKPKYSVYVMIDDPAGDEYYGASVAGPVFAAIAQQVYTSDINLVPEFKPTEQVISSPVTRIVHQGNAKAVYRKLDISSPTEPEGLWVKATETAGKLAFSKVSIAPGKVPSVYGMTARDAMVLLESLGLKVNLSGHGKVVGQSIEPGEAIAGRSLIVLQLKP
jgi:cell division protein FtsI (penicillin-binding protein 3)